MNDETTEINEVLEEAVDQGKETADDILRTLWPYSPDYFGIRVLEKPADLPTAGLDDQVRETLVGMMEQGMRVLLIEAQVDHHGEMLAILTSALQASRRFGRGGAQA